MSELVNLSRRRFLQGAAAVGGALVLGFRLDDGAQAASAGAFRPNAWLEIPAAGPVTIHVPWSELGQGPLTAVPMLLADELEADWEAIEIVRAWTDPRFGRMTTGGSRSVRTSWDPVRRAGAAGRVMLVRAAAAQWNVPESACRAEMGHVLGPRSGQRLAFGELAAAAAELEVPQEVTLKSPGERRLIGRSLPRVDLPDKIRGVTRFGCDQRLDGMLRAVVARPPVLGATVRSVDDAAARAVPGVRQVFAVDSGVAVLADDTWSALKGREALRVDWDPGANADLDSAGISARLAAADPAAAAIMRDDGDVPGALAGAARTVEAVYEVPYLCHAPMEPMNCTVRLQNGRCEVWAPIQSTSWGQAAAAQAAGLTPDKVVLQPTFSGGGFGRRLMVDYVAEAVQIAKRAGVPVQTFWTREDDVRHGFYRPASRHTMRAALTADGSPVAWSCHLAAPSISGQLDANSVPGGRDEGAVDGLTTLPYTLDHVRVAYSMVNTPVPVCWLRSVYNTQNALANECFVDELAQAGGVDPVRWRLDRLPRDSRLRGTLERAAAAWGWPRTLPAGHGQGVACHACFGSYVTEMAEVSTLPGGGVRVHRVLCVVDCGPVVHPDGLRAQIEGGVALALSNLLREQITVRSGAVEQSNFDDYQPLRLHEMPEVEVITIDSEEAIGGIGEPGYPPLGPAVLNALFAATGQRVRRLPLADNFQG